MNAADLSFTSSDFLRLLEGLGLTGSWGWTLATGDQVWSPGLFRLLGLEVGEVTPSYERLIQFVHPEDQDRLIMMENVDTIMDMAVANRASQISIEAHDASSAACA